MPVGDIRYQGVCIDNIFLHRYLSARIARARSISVEISPFPYFYSIPVLQKLFLGGVYDDLSSLHFPFEGIPDRKFEMLPHRLRNGGLEF